MTIQEFKAVFDREFEAEIQERVLAFESYTTDETLKSLIRHVQTLIRAGGKRVRPYVCVTSYLAFGGSEDNLPFIRRRVMALELFHLFALIHDDIIDCGKTRHGVPTIHEFAKNLLRKEGRRGDVNHIANSHAVMVGDLVFSWAHALWFEGYAEKEYKEEYARATTYFSQMSTEVIVGEMLDVDMTTRQTVSHNLITQKTLLKTATYTFTRPMQIGLSFADWTKEAETFCTDFGTSLGFAFQLQDDLLDIIGDEKKTAKPTLQDIAEGQHTLCTEFVFEKGDMAAQELLRSSLGHVVLPQAKRHLITMFHSTGAIDHVKDLVQKYFTNARTLLQETGGIRNEVKEEFHALIDIIEERSS
jgi:geranylgeranyl diphosphate synthase type I